MAKKSIAQTRPLVQLSINRQRQLGQLSRLAPALYEQVINLIHRFPGLDHNRRVADAVKLVLKRKRIETETTRTVLVNVAQPNGGCQLEVVEVPGADKSLYDLVIASRKYGYGSTTNAAAPIAWWKLAGQEKEVPPRTVSLTNPVVQKHLEAYELVDTEVHPTEIVRKYRRLEVTGG